MRLLYLAMFAVLILASYILAQTLLADNQFLDVLLLLQQKVSSLEINVAAPWYKMDAATDQLKVTPYYANCRVTMDGAPGGRLRYSFESSLPWHGNDGKLLPNPSKTVHDVAFNGKVSMYVRRIIDNAGQERIDDQAIRPFRLDDNERMVMIAGAHLNLFACYYEDMGLVEYLKGCGDWTLLSQTGDVCVIRHFVKQPLPEIRRYRELTVDLGRGGAITSLKEFDETNGALLNEYKNVVLKEYTPGIWLPESADFEYHDLKQLDRCSFTKVVVNQPVPDNTLTLAFEPGIVLRDLIANRTFIVGADDESPEDVVRDAILIKADAVSDIPEIEQPAQP